MEKSLDPTTDQPRPQVAQNLKVESTKQAINVTQSFLRSDSWTASPTRLVLVKLLYSTRGMEVLNVIQPQGGNFHLKIGGAQSSGNAGDPMLRVAVSGGYHHQTGGRWSKIVLLQKDLFFF